MGTAILLLLQCAALSFSLAMKSVWLYFKTMNGPPTTMETRSAALIAALVTIFLCTSCMFKQESIPIDAAPVMGPPGARTEIIVFSDFQCSFCKKAARELSRLQKSHPNRLKVIYKHFPLQYHPFAQKAAHASEAAKLQGKFWEMHDQLFGHAAELSDSLILDLAKSLHLDMKKFETDLNSKKVVTKVNADRADGEKLGVTGTPYFFINREAFHGSYLDLKRKI